MFSRGCSGVPMTMPEEAPPGCCLFLLQQARFASLDDLVQRLLIQKLREEHLASMGASTLVDGRWER